MGRGRQGSGVEIRESSLRISFVWSERAFKETLFIEAGKPLPPTPPNIKYAKRVAAEIRAKIAGDSFVFADYFPYSPRAEHSPKGSVGDFLDTWFAQAELKRSTSKTYLRMKDNFWKPKVGNIPLDKLKHSDITKALKAGGWKSGKTRNNYLSMISAALELAVNDDLIPKNPCDKIEAATWQKAGPDPFDADEVERILAHMQEKYDAQVANFTEFRFFTGLRTSEAIGLEWPAVDLHKNQVRVQQGFVIDEMEDTTKTSAIRDVRLNSRALAALKRQKKHTFIAGARVFHDPHTGQPWAYEQNFRKAFWTPTLKALGIRYRRPYSMRSTYATFCLMAGANPAFVAQQLGHSLEVFFKDYAKWINHSQDQSEMDKIEGSVRADTALRASGGE